MSPSTAPRAWASSWFTCPTASLKRSEKGSGAPATAAYEGVVPAAFVWRLSDDADEVIPGLIKGCMVSSLQRTFGFSFKTLTAK
jgi:hypothetical protein